MTRRVAIEEGVADASVADDPHHRVVEGAEGVAGQRCSERARQSGWHVYILLCAHQLHRDAAVAHHHDASCTAKALCQSGHTVSVSQRQDATQLCYALFHAGKLSRACASGDAQPIVGNVVRDTVAAAGEEDLTLWLVRWGRCVIG